MDNNLDLANLNKIDPLKRMVERQTEQEEFSPFDPPDAYDLPATDEIPVSAMHPYLQQFMREHEVAKDEVSAFEATLHQIKAQGMQPDNAVEDGLKRFFTFLDTKALVHNRREEQALFPLLHTRLLEHGNHSKSETPHTPVDMMEDDHTKILQLAAVSFNFMGLASRLPDPKSRLLTMDTAITQAEELVELLNLHIFREEKIVFPLAMKYITKEEFDVMQAKA